MSDKTTDLLALHYQGFFQLSKDSWKEIFEIETPPLYAWQQYFGEPFETFALTAEQMEQLKNLTHLFAADTAFDQTLLNTFFKKLELLDISHHQIDFGALHLIGIHTVIAKDCKLQDKDLVHFTGCQKFIARFNSITSFDNILPTNPDIEEINLQDNRLEKITGIIKNTSLKSLDCTRNMLTDVSGLAQFQGLEYLHISNNLISNIDSILELVDLKEISLENNRFEDDYLENVSGKLEDRGVTIVSNY